MVVSKRIQVLLKPHLNKAVEDLAEQQGESVSRMAALLVQEALTARGLNPSISNHLPPDIEDSIRREVAAVDRGWKPSDGLESLEDKTPEWMDGLPDNVQVEKVMDNTNASDQAQLMKLKLMQDLMNQLKEM